MEYMVTNHSCKKDGLLSRRLTVDDYGLLSELYNSVGWTKRAMASRAILQRNLVYGLFKDEIFVSAVEVCARSPRAWMLCSMATHSAFQGKGYATQLLCRLTELAYNQAISRLCLYVDPSNEPARRLYERLGFKLKAEKPRLVYEPTGAL
ncbi:MAG: GNAT family N-acetyltransferase [Pyrodictiaceae archaeon]